MKLNKALICQKNKRSSPWFCPLLGWVFIPLLQSPVLCAIYRKRRAGQRRENLKAKSVFEPFQSCQASLTNSTGSNQDGRKDEQYMDPFCKELGGKEVQDPTRTFSVLFQDCTQGGNEPKNISLHLPEGLSPPRPNYKSVHSKVGSSTLFGLCHLSETKTRTSEYSFCTRSSCHFKALCLDQTSSLSGVCSNVLWGMEGALNSCTRWRFVGYSKRIIYFKDYSYDYTSIRCFSSATMELWTYWPNLFEMWLCPFSFRFRWVPSHWPSKRNRCKCEGWTGLYIAPFRKVLWN